MSRTLDLKLSIADWELQRQGISLDPALQTISDFLDQHQEMIEKVRRDLERGLKNSQTGRSGIAPPQALRSLVLMRIKNWDYRELRERINDGYTLRRFTAFFSQPVPQHHAFNRAFNRLTPETLRTVNEWGVRRRAVWDWRMARTSASTPPWWKPTSTTPPKTPSCGTPCASSRV